MKGSRNAMDGSVGVATRWKGAWEQARDGAMEGSVGASERRRDGREHGNKRETARWKGVWEQARGGVMEVSDSLGLGVWEHVGSQRFMLGFAFLYFVGLYWVLGWVVGPKHKLVG
jgi:hypothetical protein